MPATSTVETLAHLSDVHLPLLGFTPGTWGLKRLTGFINWHRSRVHVHRAEVAARLLSDVVARAPAHVAVTGDLANLGLPAELDRARHWLEQFGSAERVSVVPGNHDIYVPFGRDPGIGRWRAYMTSDRDHAAPAEHRLPTTEPDAFPFVRVRGHLALIGLCSAAPMPPFIAAGVLGEAQLGRLRTALTHAKSQGLARVVLIHHPPLPEQAPSAKALRDAEALAGILGDVGAELVLHGHMHTASLAWWPSATGAVPVLGVPSASAAVAHGGEPLARYHLLRFTQRGGGTMIDLEAYGLVEPAGPVVEIARIALVPGARYPA